MESVQGELTKHLDKTNDHTQVFAHAQPTSHTPIRAATHVSLMPVFWGMWLVWGNRIQWSIGLAWCPVCLTFVCHQCIFMTVASLSSLCIIFLQPIFLITYSAAKRPLPFMSYFSSFWIPNLLSKPPPPPRPSSHPILSLSAAHREPPSPPPQHPRPPQLILELPGGLTAKGCHCRHTSSPCILHGSHLGLHISPRPQG